MHRSILEFTDPGFEPLKRVNKMFKTFEERRERLDAVAAEVEKRKETYNTLVDLITFNEIDSRGRRRIPRDQCFPYVTLVTLVQWMCTELCMPMSVIVCDAAAYGGYLDVLQWLRVRIHHVLGMRMYAGLQLRMVIWTCCSGLVLRIHHVTGVRMYAIVQLGMAIWTCSSGLVLRIHHVTGMLKCAIMPLRMATWMCSNGLVLRIHHVTGVLKCADMQL